MHYAFVAIAEEDTPVAADYTFQHVVTTYVSETNKTASMWRAVPEALLEFRPHAKTNSIRTILEHQLLSERRFFAEFVGLEEPPADAVLPSGEAPTVAAYVWRYVELARRRLPQLAEGTRAWWLEERDVFGQRRERIWTFWRRVLHTCHHRTQVQAWLRLANQHVPPIYGPSGDVSWEGATPTYKT
jgi:uncharacterized damage-inducible protein DinB